MKEFGFQMVCTTSQSGETNYILIRVNKKDNTISVIKSSDDFKDWMSTHFKNTSNTQFSKGGIYHSVDSKGNDILNIRDKVFELIMKSVGPVFVYTYFNKAGVIPLAFALEMNGYKRYKQYENPLIESNEKDATYRGDYIIYTGDMGLSQYARDYLDKGEFMRNEKNVKVFIGSSKASEGLNLFGYREVHILDPWYNINLIEQSIGRVIRTGSHLHLPPQDRNVVVYQHVATIPEQETADLRMYKLCENKAIKAGVVEKILKEKFY
jgi:hypothetical protein